MVAATTFSSARCNLPPADPSAVSACRHPILQTSLAQLTLLDLIKLPFDAMLFLIVVVWWQRWAFSREPKRYDVWGCVGLAGLALAIIATIVIASRR